MSFKQTLVALYIDNYNLIVTMVDLFPTHCFKIKNGFG
jgi:hypothetical protein